MSAVGYGICFEIICDEMTDSSLKKKFLNDSNTVYEAFYQIMKLNQFSVSLVYCMPSRHGIIYGFVIRQTNKLTQIDILKRLYNSLIAEFDDVEPSMSYSTMKQQALLRKEAKAAKKKKKKEKGKNRIKNFAFEIQDSWELEESPLISNFELFYEIYDLKSFDKLEKDWEKLMNENKIGRLGIIHDTIFR